MEIFFSSFFFFWRSHQLSNIFCMGMFVFANVSDDDDEVEKDKEGQKGQWIARR